MIPGFRDVLSPFFSRVRRRIGPFAAGAAAAGLCFLLASFFSSSGPADYAGLPDGETAALLREAREKLSAGDAEGAGRVYDDLVVSQPLNANARMLQGIHLQDMAKDPFGAIGAFRAFLRLAPGSEKGDMVRERIHACELEIAKRVHAADAAAGESAGKDEDASARVEALAAALDAARADAAAVRDQLGEALSERDQLKRTNENLQKQIDALKGAGSGARAPRDDLTDRFDRLSERAGDLPSARNDEPAVRIADYMTYEVKRGDTLWKIAQAAYHDGSRTAEIKAANPGLVGADGSVREGTVLRIPR